jgi:two-component system, OmpR family, sensor histidine kinase TctE
MFWKKLEQASIRFRLLALLLPTMVAVTATSLWLTHTDALNSGNAAYDRSLLGAIKALDLNTSTASGGLSVELPYRLFEFFELTATGNVYFRVATADGLVEIGHPDLPQPPAPLRTGQPVFYDAVYFGETVRIGAFMRPLEASRSTGEQLVIQVAESTTSRERFTTELMHRALWRDFWLWAVMGLAVILGLTLALRPLTRLAAQTRARQVDDLRALPTDGLPHDLLPLVDAVNQQLARTQCLMAERRAFIDDASHQLRTPLSVLKTQVDYTMREPDPDRRNAAIQALSDELNHAIRATNQLLTLGQSDANHIEQDDVDLGQLVRSVAMALLPLARAKRIDLGVDMTDAPLLAQGDRHLLEQALLNITHNAMEHGPQDGTVTLTAGRSHTRQWLQVTDNGPGMPQEVHTRMGQRFVKSQRSRGSGLGLAIAHSVMTRHGGQLRSTASTPGHGHTVTLEWPCT